MMSSQIRLSRRAALQGLGISLALPWLESLVPATLRAADATSPPRRMAFIFVPNGAHMNDWTPSTEGFGYRLPPTLEPLAKVQEDVVVLSGLAHDKGRANGDGPGDHARSASVFLTGAQPRKTAGSNIRSGVSVDQVAAQKIGKLTKFASLELGCERGRSAGNCDSGYSCAYSSNISWSSESTPVAKETNPRLVFERLFSQRNLTNLDEAARRRTELKKSILDFVAEDARRLQNQLGGSDVRKLDEYLNGVREIERRIELAERQPARGDGPKYDDPKYDGPAGIPREYAEHIRLMCDMVVLAFQTDSTRVATLMFADAGSNRSYREIDVPDGHHDLSHHGGDRKKQEKIAKINRFHVAQLAYLLEKMKAVAEGDGTLLDNSMVLYGSGLCDGNRHNHENLPILLAGRGGGTIDSGRHIHCEAETPMCNLLLSLLDRVGAPADFIGDSTGRLRDLQI